MNTRKSMLVLLALCIALLPALACGLPANLMEEAGATAVPGVGGDPAQPDDKQPGGLPLFNKESPTPLPTATLMPSPTPTPIPADPIGLKSGLASLDSYRFTMRFTQSGPGPNTMSEMLQESAFSRASDATWSRTTNKSSDEDYPTPEIERQEQFVIGLESCSFEEGAWEYVSLEPQSKEVLNALNQLFDFSPVISNPVFVAQETTNGVTTNHFTFELQSAGAESGSVVSQNKGDYWLAADGQYLVYYLLNLEFRNGPADDPNAEVARLEIEYNLYDINGQVDLSFPAECRP
jgi:hypothetical protein